MFQNRTRVVKCVHNKNQSATKSFTDLQSVWREREGGESERERGREREGGEKEREGERLWPIGEGGGRKNKVS